MRLRYMEKLLDDNLRQLQISANGNNSGTINVTNISETVNAITNLEQIEFLKNDINEMKKIQSIFNSRIEPSIVSREDWNLFSDILVKIREKSSAVIKASQQVIAPQEKNSISVKLPPSSSLLDISGYLTTLDKSLNQAVVNDSIKGKVEVNNVDAGSIWLDIVVGSASAVILVGALAWSAAVIRKKILEGDLLLEKVRSLKINNEALHDMKKGLDSEINVLCEAEGKAALASVGVDKPDPESLERIKFSVKMLAELINKGAEIHPGLMAPENVKNLFPDFSQIGLIESKAKQLSATSILEQLSNDESGNNEES